MKCIDGSDLLSGKHKTRVQDAYSMRSSPQVIGAAHDALKFCKSQVEIELNGVGDNPIFFPQHKLTLTGANFQGTPVSLPMEMAGQAITMILRDIRTPVEPAVESRPQRRLAALSHQGRGHVQRHDAQPVHCGQSHRRAADSLLARRDGLHSRGG